jgi:hypothetical protein
MPVTLPIDKLGLNPQFFGSVEKFHSARCLPGSGSGRLEIL